MNDIDDNDCDVDIREGSLVQVPMFPNRKRPTNANNNSPKIQVSSPTHQVSSPSHQLSSPSHQGSSTENSLVMSKYSLNRVESSNIFDMPVDFPTEEIQILSLIHQFKKSSGITRRDLECNIIRNLINQRKVIDQQEQYMMSPLWAKEYTSYLYDNQAVRPQQIDNSSLFNDTVFKQNMQNSDYVLVNGSVWLFLQQEYGGGPEAPFESYQQISKSQISQSLKPMIVPIRAKSASTEVQINTQEVKVAPKGNFEMATVGFKNELYFCYMNSGLQSLLSLPEFNCFFMRTFKSYFKESTSRKIAHLNMETTLAYLDLIDQIRHNEKKEYIKIGALKSLLSKKFNPRHQHDCQEFVLHLLSSIEDEINAFFKEVRRIDVKSRNYEINMIQYLFQGQIESKIQCNNVKCMHSTSLIEPFLTLSIALKAHTLEECLDDFFRDEKVKDYKCEKCNISQCVKKSFLSQQPKNVIFHIKRFKFFPKSHKLSQIVTFPLDNLSMQKYHNKQTTVRTYKLRALIVHQGNLDSGHYYSFGRRFHQWFQFNDQTVRKVSKKDLQNQQAYLLFYSQNNND